MSSLVRNTDPQESHDAAARVSRRAAKDRTLVLIQMWEQGPATAREVALAAAGAHADTARIESLRRRVSDLKERGWIVQVGRRNGRGTFDVTSAGETELARLDAELR